MNSPISRHIMNMSTWNFITITLPLAILFRRKIHKDCQLFKRNRFHSTKRFRPSNCRSGRFIIQQTTLEMEKNGRTSLEETKRKTDMNPNRGTYPDGIFFRCCYLFKYHHPMRTRVSCTSVWRSVVRVWRKKSYTFLSNVMSRPRYLHSSHLNYFIFIFLVFCSMISFSIEYIFIIQ